MIALVTCDATTVAHPQSATCEHPRPVPPLPVFSAIMSEMFK